jgi:hypothetical protein
MTKGQIPFRADIAGAMPPNMMADVEMTLKQASRSLGMFEAYDAFAKQNDRFEPLLQSDRITVALLEDIHERASCVVEDAGLVADRGHTDGFVAMMRMTINDVVPDLEALREQAATAIAVGYNIEEEMPEFGQAGEVLVASPFAPADPIVAFENQADEEDLSF